jgi:AcrR family transcriptional regulator
MTAPAARGDPARRSRLSAEQRRASIIAAATEVFSEVGYHHGTMAEVARRVGVSEPVVFQNFGTKAAVFNAVIEHATERMTTVMTERAAANRSVGAWLTELLAPHDPSHMHAGHAHHVLFADAMSHTAEPLVSEAIRQAHRTVAQTLTDLLARGQAEGSVRQDLDPATGAWWLLCFLASRGFRAATMPEHSRLEAQLSALTLQVLTTSQPDGTGHPGTPGT